MNDRLTPEAEQDFLEIIDYIASDSVAAGVKVLHKFEQRFERLGEMPGLGHYQEELLPKSYRFFAIYSYLIVYRWKASPIEIVAIIHGARDLARRLRRDDLV